MLESRKLFYFSSLKSFALLLCLFNQQELTVLNFNHFKWIGFFVCKLYLRKVVLGDSLVVQWLSMH